MPTPGDRGVRGQDQHRTDRHQHERVVPIVQEEANIRTRIREEEALRLHRKSSSREETLKIPVTTEHVDVQRIAVNATADGPVPPWRDGDTLVVPVMEQVPVVRMQWIVREEIRVTRTVKREEHRQTVRLQREDVEIDRTRGPGGRAGMGRPQEGDSQ